MPRIEDDKLEFTDDLLVLWQGQPFTGIAYEHGAGKALTEMEYKNGIQHGITREWSQSGRLIAEGHYEYAILVSEETWDEEGKLIHEFHITPDHPSFKRWQYYKRTQGEDVDPYKGIVPGVPPEKLFGKDSNSD